MELISGLLLTQNSTPIFKYLVWILGKLLDLIYNLGIHNIGVCIIVLTFVVYFLMLPLTIKQQKFSKLSNLMQPEIQAIQKKYKGKQDQASMAKMQEEQRAVYDKFGTSPTGGCLNLLITMPLLFAFYRVVWNIPAYVESLKSLYINSGVVKAIMNSSSKVQGKFIDLASKAPIRVSMDKLSSNKIIDALWKFNDKNWAQLKKWIPDSSDKITSLANNIKEYTTFLCYNIAETPMFMMQNGWADKNYGQVALALLIPVLAGITQWSNIKLMPQPQQSPENEMASSLKTMNLVMPLFSVYICFTLPIGLGLYWIAAAIFRSIQQICINRYLDKVPVEDIIAKNKEKQAKKRARKGVPSGEALREKASVYTRSIDEPSKKPETISDKAGKASDIDSPVSNTAPKAGSLAAKAAMVKKFNESNKSN